MIRPSRPSLAALASLALVSSGVALSQAQPAPAPSPAPTASAAPGPATGGPAAGAQASGVPAAGVPASGVPAAGATGSAPVMIYPAPPGAGLPPGSYLVVPQGSGGPTAYYGPPAAPAAAPPSAAKPVPKPVVGARLHDGFYLSMMPGLIWHRGHLSAPGLVSEASTRGTGFAFDFALGGSVSRNLVLAAQWTRYEPDVTLESTSAGSSTCRSGGDTTQGFSCETSFDYSALSLLGVFYPDPTEGWNIQLAVGYGTGKLSRLAIRNVTTGAGVRETLAVDDLDGVHVMVAGGHEFFVSPQWSIGPLLRVDLGRLRQDGAPQAQATFLSPSLRLAFTYH